MRLMCFYAFGTRFQALFFTSIEIFCAREKPNAEQNRF